MRKLLISILIALLLILTVYSVIKGLSIGNIKILGFNNIKSESEKLDTEIAEITKMKEQTYKKALSDIESNAKQLLQEKEKYASIVSASTESEIEKATHNQKYEQDFLWAKIGNHATAQGVQLKFDIAIGSVNKENYDLYFTVGGSYTNITEFVMALENDNLLGFKIENFKLVPGGSTAANKTDGAKQNANTTNTNNTTTDTTNSTENTTTEDNTSGNETNTNSKESNEGTLQATFKVTDIEINIDKTKVTNTGSNKTNTQNTTTKQNTTNTARVSEEGVVEE